MRYDAGSDAWEAPVEITDQVVHVGAPAIHAPTGYAVVAWSRYIDGSARARRYVPGTGWSAVEVISDTLLREPTLSMDSEGDCIVAFTRLRNPPANQSDYEIMMSRCTPASGWSALENGPDTLGHTARYAYPALDTDGSVLVTWTNGLDSGCYASRLPAGGAWSARETIDLPGGGLAVGFPFATGGGGAAIVGWESRYAGGLLTSAVWVNEHHPTNGWGMPVEHRSCPGVMREMFRRVDTKGRAAVVWRESTAPNSVADSNVWIARYR